MSASQLDIGDDCMPPTPESRDPSHRAFRMAALKASKYKLGAGGTSPDAPTPFTVRDGVLGSDCIGFVLWCLGQPRFQKTFPHYGGWINTDSSIADARSTNYLWRIVNQPEPGDVVVFPSIYKDGKRARIGHIGLIVACGVDTSRWTANLWKRDKSDRATFLRHIKVIDCAAALSRRILGRAIKETTAAASWNKPDAVFLRMVK